MKLIASLGAAVALSFVMVQGASAHYVTKSLSCLPSGGTSGEAFRIDCQVSVVFGTVRNDCSCPDGYVLYNPKFPLKIEDGNGTGSGPRGPRNATDS